MKMKVMKSKHLKMALMASALEMKEMRKPEMAS